MRLIVIISILLTTASYSQEVEDDSLKKVQEIQGVEVQVLNVSVRIARERVNHLKRRDIEQLQATDVGELLQKFEGTSLKSYGGLGGLKTVSFRGLGSQHTTVCVDGFNLSNSQTGQVNLGQLQTENIEQLVVSVGEQPRLLLPVAAQISGSSILIETFENSFTNDKFGLRSIIRQGSFGRLGGYLGAKWKVGKGFISAFGNANNAYGEYKYRIQNGFEVDSSNRLNNDYQDYAFGATYGLRMKKTNFRIGYRQKSIDQGLPGAVILYNSSADERLNTLDQVLFTDAMIALNDLWYMRAYASANSNQLNYTDPTYLNADGFIDVAYSNKSLNLGVVGYRFKQKWDFNTGLESTVSSLSSNDSLFANPTRYSYSAIAGARYSWWMLALKGQLSTRYITELNENGESASDKMTLNPYLSLESQERGRMYHRHQLWYKNSFRMPSFNELYYNNIGNSGLIPERADQFGYNLSFVPVERNLDWHIRVAGYFNRVRNKIVATPTKNLFVWSMQNIGKVDVFGGEVVSKLKYTFKKNRRIKISSNATYSLQKALNMTDPEHPSYRHQIAYIPIHSANLDLGLELGRTGIRLSTNYVGLRYSLNENISSNELDQFILMDISAYHSFDWRNKNRLRIQVSVKNVFDSSYAYIRSFVMPGRNYLISVSYAIN